MPHLRLPIFILFWSALLFFGSAEAQQKCFDVVSDLAPKVSEPVPAAKERARLYRDHIGQLFNADSVQKAGDLLHGYWQETNTYLTRYKVVKDASGRTVKDISGYMAARLLPAALKGNYRINKNGDVEEDIKAISNRHLAPNNRAENNAGAKSILEQVAGLLVAAPADENAATERIQSALQNIHAQWLARNTWARGSYPENVRDLPVDLQITNTVPLLRLFEGNNSNTDIFHLRIARALEGHLALLNAKQLEKYKDSGVGEAYLSMISEKGVKVRIDSVLEKFFDAKIPFKQMARPPPDSSMPALQEFYSAELRGEIQEGLKLSPGFSLKAPATPPGSGAQVFLVRDAAGAVAGALKIQSKKANGLDELLSSLATSYFLKSSRAQVKSAEVVKYGLLSNGSYYMLIEPARARDLDGSLGPMTPAPLSKIIFEKAALFTAELHSFPADPAAVSKETRQTFKGNALYDVRILKQFLDGDVLEKQMAVAGLPAEAASALRQTLAKSAANYEGALENQLELFRPTTTHGDYHGGNIFFNPADSSMTMIDFASVTWTLAKSQQPGTGDPANDIGRMLGHFLIEDIRHGHVSDTSYAKVRNFYALYLRDTGLEPGSPAERVLRGSVVFYMNRYFSLQASDTGGTKFNSTVLSRQQLLRDLFSVWSRLNSVLPENP